MKRTLILKWLLLAVVATTAIRGLADLAPIPHLAMGYPRWVLEKTTGGHGCAALLALSLVSVIVLTYFYIRHRRQGHLKEAKLLVRRTIMTIIVSWPLAALICI